MKILLMGEYSNVHWTLAEGLRALGHKVTVLSNGDYWKNYPRDISLVRRPGKLGGVAYMARLYSLLPRLRGYDVVQFINPMFLDIKAERIRPIYRYLRRHNKHLVLDAFGMDYYWAHVCSTDMPLRYSDFNLGHQLRTNADAVIERRDWIGTEKEKLNREMAADCDAIVCGLYEYWVCYHPAFPEKTVYLPFPIRQKMQPSELKPHTGKLKLFIGINKTRSEYKGTDIMLSAAQEVASRHADRVELRVAESVPFAQYVEMMNGSDAILDQLYSYTPAMNSLEAMSRGIVSIGGGEEECYEILGETELRPIVNVLPQRESVVEALEQLALHPDRIDTLKRESLQFIARHHDHIQVARAYAQLYESL